MSCFTHDQVGGRFERAAAGYNADPARNMLGNASRLRQVAILRPSTA